MSENEKRKEREAKHRDHNESTHRIVHIFVLTYFIKYYKLGKLRIRLYVSHLKSIGNVCSQNFMACCTQ